MVRHPRLQPPRRQQNARVLDSAGLGSGLDVVDLSAVRAYPGWSFHQALAMRACFARTVAAAAQWALFLDIDEFLIVSPTWLSASAFQWPPALSFGSRPMCAPHPVFHSRVGGPCVPSWKGYRKYALAIPSWRTAAHPSRLRFEAPQYIHAHHRELLVSTASGMHIFHANDNNGTCRFGRRANVASADEALRELLSPRSEGVLRAAQLLRNASRVNVVAAVGCPSEQPGCSFSLSLFTRARRRTCQLRCSSHTSSLELSRGQTSKSPEIPQVRRLALAGVDLQALAQVIASTIHRTDESTVTIRLMERDLPSRVD
eukprot:3885697-Prymnesium_polylepis.1